MKLENEKLCLMCGIRMMAESKCPLPCNHRGCDCECNLLGLMPTKNVTREELVNMFPEGKKK